MDVYNEITGSDPILESDKIKSFLKGYFSENGMSPAKTAQYLSIPKGMIDSYLKGDNKSGNKMTYFYLKKLLHALNCEIKITLIVGEKPNLKKFCSNTPLNKESSLDIKRRLTDDYIYD